MSCRFLKPDQGRKSVSIPTVGNGEQVVFKTHWLPILPSSKARAWIFMTAGGAFQSRVNPTMLPKREDQQVRLVQSFEDLSQRGSTVLAVQIGQHLGLNRVMMNRFMDYLSQWAVLRRCCGTQMSDPWRSFLHGNLTEKANSSKCHLHSVRAVEADLLRTYVYQKFHGDLTVRRLSVHDGNLTGRYCEVANAMIAREKLPFNANLQPSFDPPALHAPCRQLVDRWVDQQRSLSLPRLLWSPPSSGLGDQITSLVTVFWFSLLQRRRLELVPEYNRGALSLGDVILFGGGDVEVTLSRAMVDAQLKNPRLAVVTQAQKTWPGGGHTRAATGGGARTNLMSRWAQLRSNLSGWAELRSNLSGTTIHIDRWNLGDQTDFALRAGWLAAAGVDTRPPIRPTDLSSCVMRGLLAPKHASGFKVSSSSPTKEHSSSDIHSRPLICMQIRTGKLMTKQLRALMNNFTVQTSRGLELEHARAGLHATAIGAIPRVNDAEMLGATVVNFTVDHVPAFTRCATQIQHALGKAARLFVTTDSMSLRRSIAHAYGSNVLLAPWTPSHISDSSVELSAFVQALAEWHTLADDCDHVIITESSSFGLTAAAVAQASRKASVHLISSERHGRPASGLEEVKCSPHTEYIEFAQMSMIDHGSFKLGLKVAA